MRNFESSIWLIIGSGVIFFILIFNERSWLIVKVVICFLGVYLGSFFIMRYFYVILCGRWWF